MSWEKIEEHLFDKYLVEGEDKELGQLMEEHDKEIRQSAIQEFIERISIACKTYVIGNDAKNGHIIYAHSDGTWHNLMEDIAKQMKEIEVDVTYQPAVYECYEKQYGGFNLRTCFYTKEQVNEFAATVGKRILSSSSIQQMYDAIKQNGRCTHIWDLQYSDVKLIPEKYLPPKEDITDKCFNRNFNLNDIRECMNKYLEANPCVYPWIELGCRRFGELVYIHMDGSGDKLRGVIGSDGYPDILNDRGESVFDYMEEMDMTQEDVDYIRGIIDKINDDFEIK